MHKSKAEFYLSEFSSSTSKKRLFAVCNKLLGLEKLSPFPNIHLMDQLSAIFNDFFISNVKLIRTSIDQHKLQKRNSTTIAQTSLTFSDSFQPVTIKQMHAIIKYSKPTSCALDPIPTSLLLECHENILPALTHIIITSILLGQFPTNMKTVIVKPLVKNAL